MSFLFKHQEFSNMSRPFTGATLACKICGSAFKVPPSRASTAEYCSIECSSVGRRKRRNSVTLTCQQCSKPFETPVCHAGRRKFCSYECKHASVNYRVELSRTRIGAANPMWIGGVVPHSDGYVYERAIDHPFTSNGYVLQHRLVMERWLRENQPDSPFLIRLGENLYLSPEFLVHHDDEVRDHNEIGNLVCLTNSQHQKLHSERRHLKINGPRAKPPS